MNIADKEILQEIFEVIGRTADECVYIIEERDALEEERLQEKLHARAIRISDEIGRIFDCLDAVFDDNSK